MVITKNLDNISSFIQKDMAKDYEAIERYKANIIRLESKIEEMAKTKGAEYWVLLNDDEKEIVSSRRPDLIPFFEFVEDTFRVIKTQI